jgi:hypothetical protein
MFTLEYRDGKDYLTVAILYLVGSSVRDLQTGAELLIRGALVADAIQFRVQIYTQRPTSSSLRTN